MWVGQALAKKILMLEVSTVRRKLIAHNSLKWMVFKPLPNHFTADMRNSISNVVLQ